ncbi:hypothetical protein J4210_05075 [Candidatus Woesearchaeota archaeon]|nr:hypothetical protein [Candidatus Woesearchaeota archaeon]
MKTENRARKNFGQNKKGAIEISANMLVVLIIALVIFAGGITLLYKFISTAETVKMDLDARTEAEIQRLLLEEGKQVALPLNKAELKRGEQKVFGLGVLNTAAPETFIVLVNPAVYIPLQGEEEENPLIGSWVLYDEEPFLLGEQEAKDIPIRVAVPKDGASGTYLFDVSVQKSDGIRYGPIQKIQVDVK